MLCVGQDTFLLNTRPIFPVVDSGWQHQLLSIQMELHENPEFSGPEKSYREIAAAVLNDLVEPTHGRAGMVFLITEKQNYENLGGRIFSLS